MKKIIFVLLFSIFTFIPYNVFATEYCEVISGSGHDLGDEVACGEEHFYLLSNENNQVELFAKYNLYVGVEIHKEKINKESGDTRTDEQYCSDLATERGGAVKSDLFYTDPGYCYYVVNINVDRIEQKEIAKSAHWDSDLNYLYPQVGDVYFKNVGTYSGDTFEFVHTNPGWTGNPKVQENTNFYDAEINFNGSSSNNNYKPTIIVPTLKNYKQQFIDDSYLVESIGLLKLSKLNSIIQQISNQSLPLKDWNDNVQIVQGTYYGKTEDSFYYFGDLKPYIPSDYKWLYSTTYWNSSYFYNSNVPLTKWVPIFVAEQGKLCGAGFVNCAPQTELGCGVRPVITLNESGLKYMISPTNSEHGTIEVVNSSLPGENVSFKVSANNGYKLSSILVTTMGGAKIELTEDDFEVDQQGNVVLKNSSFVMPNESVTIEARWSLINPITRSPVLVVIIIFQMILGIGIVVYQLKKV